MKNDNANITTNQVLNNEESSINKTKTIAVFFGGQSPEHDVSIITGVSAFKNLNVFKYNALPVYISKDNRFFVGDALGDINFYKKANFNLKQKGIKEIVFLPNSKFAYEVKGALLSKKKRKLKPFIKIDAAILATHGGMGENGTLSSMLNLSGIASSGASLAHAAAMDKSFAKKMFSSIGLNTAKTILEIKDEKVLSSKQMADEVLNSSSFIESKKSFIFNLNFESFPLVVKPSNLGSSIGVKIAKNKLDLTEAITFAERLDKNILVEEFINGRELNCAAFKRFNSSTGTFEIVVSEIEEPIKDEEVLSFEDKYLDTDNGSSGAMTTLKRIFPAKISVDVKEKIQSAVKKIYSNFNFNGVIRCDFFLREKEISKADDWAMGKTETVNEIIINEVNSIPGSLAFYLFKDKFSFNEMLDELIISAIKEKETKQSLISSFESSLIEDYKEVKISKLKI